MSEQLILKAIADLRSEIKNDIDAINNNINEKFTIMQEDIQEIKKKQRDLEKRIITNEKDLRKRNIVIHNLEEAESSKSELEAKILDLVNSTLGVDMILDEIDFIHRLGRSTGKARPLLLGITTYRKKRLIMESKNKLREVPMNLILADDLPKEMAMQRKNLRTAFFEVREKGKNAKIVHNKLVVENETMSEEQLQKICIQAERKKRQRSEEEECSTKNRHAVVPVPATNNNAQLDKRPKTAPANASTSSQKDVQLNKSQSVGKITTWARPREDNGNQQGQKTTLGRGAVTSNKD